MAETVTARIVEQRFSRLPRDVEAEESFIIAHRGRPVARLVPEASTEGRRLAPKQEQALAESIAWARSLQPSAEPAGLSADWPRDRGDLYDEALRGRPL